MIAKVSPFEVYQKYISLKNHFTKKNYDYFLFNGKSKVSAASFEKRKDKRHFVRLSKIYKDEELIRFFVSNFVSKTNLWIGDAVLSEARQVYLQWKGKIQSLSYIFENELNDLFEEENDFNHIFKVQDGQHPVIVRRVLSGEISLETLIILDRILSLFSGYNKQIEETFIWPELYTKCVKYAPFLNVDKKKYADILKKQVELHYELRE